MYTINSIFIEASDEIVVLKESPAISISTEPFRAPVNLYMGMSTANAAELNASITTCDRLIAAIVEVRKRLIVEAVGMPASPALRAADDSNRPEQ